MPIDTDKIPGVGHPRRPIDVARDIVAEYDNTRETLKLIKLWNEMQACMTERAEGYARYKNQTASSSTRVNYTATVDMKAVAELSKKMQDIIDVLKKQQEPQVVTFQGFNPNSHEKAPARPQENFSGTITTETPLDPEALTAASVGEESALIDARKIIAKSLKPEDIEGAVLPASPSKFEKVMQGDGSEKDAEILRNAVEDYAEKQSQYTGHVWEKDITYQQVHREWSALFDGVVQERGKMGFRVRMSKSAPSREMARGKLVEELKRNGWEVR